MNVQLDVWIFSSLIKVCNLRFLLQYLHARCFNSMCNEYQWFKVFSRIYKRYGMNSLLKNRRNTIKIISCFFFFGKIFGFLAMALLMTSMTCTLVQLFFEEKANLKQKVNEKINHHIYVVNPRYENDMWKYYGLKFKVIL